MTSSAWQDRFGWWIIAFFLAVTPIVGYGTKAAFDGIKNRVEDWLPESFEETQRLMWFYERFGTDELLMISWEGCTLEDPRIAAYKEHLSAPDSSENPPLDYFGEVLTGPEAIESLVSEPLDLPREEAIRRLRGWLVGPDGEQTCLIAIVKNPAEVDRAAAIEYAYRCAEPVEGLGREALVIAGTTRDGVAIDEASKNSLAQLNLGSFGVCLAIMAIGFRSIRATVLVFLVAIFCEQLSMAIMYFSGQQMDSVLTLASNLTYVLAISSGVHLMNYYRESLAERSPYESVKWALRAALIPCLLSAGTTAIGMISLTVSNIQPVTNFGWYAAVSVIAAAFVLLLWAPAAMYKFPINPPAWRGRSERPSRMKPIWERLASGIEKLRWFLFIFSLIVVSLCLVGVQRITTSAQLHDLFWSDAPILQDYDWLEEKVGPLIPIEIILRYDDPQQTATDERFRVIQAVQQAIEETDGIAATMSAATFAPNIPPADQPGFRAVMQRASIRKILEGRLGEYEVMNYLQREEGDELWRISARVRAADRLNYGDLMKRLRNAVSQELENRPGIEPIYAGSVPLIFKAQTEMLNDLIKSFGLAFAMIAVIMVVLLRNVFTGIFCMVPNVMPVLLAFGFMGFWGMSVEVGTLLTASAALGIAVDDSLHYITWFKRGLAQGLSRRDAACLAYEHCGLAMIQTSLICSLGLLVFALSPFTPVSRFAWMMFSLLLLALICDLLILPAVLLCFTRKRATQD